MIKRVWRLETGLFFGIGLFLMICGRNKFFGDPGIFWHIVVGEHILSTGKLIHRDTFSFTRFGHPWIAQEWLGECIMALIHGIAGFDGLLLAAVTLLASFYTWIAHRFLRGGFHPLCAIFITVVAIAGSGYHFVIRPLLTTIVFLGVTVAMLADFEAGRSSLRRLFWLVPLFILWANIHGGYLGGMGTLLIVIGGWILMWLLGRECPISGGRQAMLLAALAILCGLAALANPYGIALPKAWYSIMNSPVIARDIAEHMPIWHFKAVMALLSLAVLLYFAALAGVLPRWPRVTWLLPLVWLGLGILRVRFGPLFATAFVIVIPDMLPYVRWFHWLSRKGSEVCRLRGQHEIAGKMRPAHFIVPVTVVAFILTLQAAGIRVPLFGCGWANMGPKLWPVGMLGELRKIESSNPAGTRIFNDCSYGGFLIYYTPRLRVFIDDRCELYGDKGLSAYVRLMKNPKGIGHLARKFGFEYALVKKSSSFYRYLGGSPNWTLVKNKDGAALFKRVSKPVLPAVISHGSKMVRHRAARHWTNRIIDEPANRAGEPPNRVLPS